MASYIELYRNLYAALGQALNPSDGERRERLKAAESEHGVHLPKALFDYYLVSGRERVFNQSFNHLYSPDEWSADSDKLIFMEDHQAVVLWSVKVSKQTADDAPVFQSVNSDPMEWFEEHDQCSVFLQVILHWQGTFGGAMKNCRSARVSAKTLEKLEEEWVFAGEVNEMRAYNLPGRAICYVPWEDGLRVFAGATHRDSLETIAADLGINWDPDT